MKKLLILSLMLGTAVVVVPSAAVAKTATAVSAGEQINVRIGQPRRRYNRRTRTVVSTRVRLINGYRYRERIRTTYFANGRTQVVVLSRTRIGGPRRVG